MRSSCASWASAYAGGFLRTHVMRPTWHFVLPEAIRFKDKYGLSWQIIPTAFMNYLSDPDQAKSGRVMEAMLKMQKIVIADLDAAANG